MEFLVAAVAVIGEVVLDRLRNCLCKYCMYHSNAEVYMEILEDKWRYLERLKLDIQSRISAQVQLGKTPRAEVEVWLVDIEKIEREIQAITREAEEMCFSRAIVGKHALKKIKVVEELYQLAHVADSLVIDPPRSIGEILPTPPTLRGGSTIERIMKEIRACMLDDDVRRIGVYGMRGIGKTTVMKEINNFLLKMGDKFDIVVWVTVSKTYSVFQLQNDIVSKLGLDLAKFGDLGIRAAMLKAQLEHKRFVLILDDIWEAFSLEHVGIPEPTYVNGCKLVLTTRLRSICNRMSCKHIRMELFSKEEAQTLFVEYLGYDVFDIPNLKPIVEEVLEQCGGLPLAIIKIAQSCIPLIHDYQWRDKLETLRISKGSFGSLDNIEMEEFEVLESNYGSLKAENLKQCLLHCALYPKGLEINKQDVIEHMTDEGIIERMESRQAELKRGYSMLTELENVCLFEGGINEYGENFVKVLDIPRVVLHVASAQFMVGHLRLEDFLDKQKWSRNLLKASLMYNNISKIHPDVSPEYPNLSILLLCGNRSLKNVPNSLFVHLCGLKVLDLSYTDIESLPNSIFSLENLTALRLRGCRNLKLVPSLAKLITLNKLDLGQTGITEVPDDLEMLVDLRYLSLNASELKIMPLGILPKLSHLQYLTVFWHSKSVIVKEEEIASLKKLETFGGHFNDMDEFSMYVRSLEKRPLACYEIRVGMSGDGNYRTGEIFGKSVILGDCEEVIFVLPKDVQYLEIKKCHKLRSLCDVPALNDTSEIKHIGLFLCKGMEHILSFASSSSSCTHSLQTLEILELYNLDNLLELFKAGSSCVPRDTFSCLKRILICNCSKIEKLLPPGLLLHLHNLEEIWVSFCKKLEEIVEEEEEGRDIIQITLPRLRILHLSGLPELKTICSSSKKLVCNSLEKIEIHGCPKLRRLPLSLPVRNGQLSPPPYLQKIETSEEWWESLEWDHPPYLQKIETSEEWRESLEWDHRNIKNVLQPFLCKL